jgi:CubicO group peptidase (beta-lactamase class C family)
MTAATASHIVIENGAATAAANADMPVPWWSFTKTVIAAAALALVDQRRLALDAPRANRPYTLRHLLQNTAGVPNYGGLKEYHDAVAHGDEPWPVPVLLERANADRLRFAPGQGWDYSNIGYLFARQAVEEAAGEEFGAALARLVLRPLGIDGVRLARERADLDGVAMGDAAGYHPGWVYHGLLVGPLASACLLLDRLMAGQLVSTTLLCEMLDIYPVGGEVPGRPWQTHGYGLGLMMGTSRAGRTVLGHTGGGPGSVVAVYHFPEGAPRSTAAAFALGNDEARVEIDAFGRGAAETHR